MNSGFLLINKPAGITSHDVVDQLRKITGIKKIGHAGTLDPFATGLLLVAVGREATKEISKFVGLDKTYEAEFVIGATTETLDTETPIITPPFQGGAGEGSANVTNSEPPLRQEIESAMQSLTGSIEQIPPMYSAIKQQGKKLYELARQGKTVDREPRSITIHSFKLIGEPVNEDGLLILPVSISCSSGTYIRALARDLGQALGSTGYVRALERTQIGPYLLANSQQLADLSQDNWTKHLKHVTLDS
ncbi:MAG: tRNA pseudouridine(55) synthase TruB [Patescibacteria group bacterium]|nr:tRNA pseudouridine(55) synthase TruB [Patescibacteria group bacterium]